MFLDLLLVALGIALLAFAGDKLVDFAAALGDRLGLSPAVIGLTVVAAGTSTPELFVSVAAAFGGSPDIAMGNVVGSNIANVGIILGVCALVAAIPVNRKIVRFEYPFMVLSSWIALLLCRDGVLDRLESGFFLASFVAFLAFSIWAARTTEMRAGLAEMVPADVGGLRPRSTGALALGAATSLVGLAVGARVLVVGAVDLARAAGLSERVIGLTLVALGTSLPEMVASLAATLKKQPDMALTNIVGSNIFNLLLILGVAGLLRPIPVSPQMVAVDLWVMMGFAVLLLPLVARDRELSRRDGIVLVGAYVAYAVLGLR